MNKISKELIKLAKEIVSFSPEKIDYLDGGPRTPWGKADFGYKLDKGVTWYTTPSHGGLGVAGGVAKRALSPQALKQGEVRSGYVWYEEDVAYVVAFYENPKWEKALSKLAGGSVMSMAQKAKTIERWMPEYFGLTKQEEEVDDTVTIKVNSALQTLVSGVVAGYTSNDHVIIFLSNDYDGRGNVRGPYEDMTKVVGDTGWNLLCTNYDDDALEDLGWDRQLQKKLLGYLKKFKSKYRASRKRTSAKSYELIKDVKTKNNQFQRGTKFRVVKYNDRYPYLVILESDQGLKLSVTPEGGSKLLRGFPKPPSMSQMERWMENGVANSIDGKRVEPDGISPSGAPSWLLALGLI